MFTEIKYKKEKQMTRLRLKGHCIFGQFVGYKDSAKQYVLFLDEETNEVKTYHRSKLELSYEKLR